jgi:hypothetical protein
MASYLSEAGIGMHHGTKECNGEDNQHRENVFKISCLLNKANVNGQVINLLTVLYS